MICAYVFVALASRLHVANNTHGRVNYIPLSAEMRYIVVLKAISVRRRHVVTRIRIASNDSQVTLIIERLRACRRKSAEYTVTKLTALASTM